MPRANRYIIPGQYYHVTHRCHNKAFLLKFARDRNEYRQRLRELLPSVAVHLLGFTITSNHVHLLLQSRASHQSTDEISQLMQLMQGQHAQAFNRRRQRHGAYWEDRFHATMVEGGRHLWRCLVYIDMNMVRAGVVAHPRDWEWSGYHELMGTRLRYKLVDMECLLAAVGAGSLEEFREHYAHAIEERLAQRAVAREPAWTESLAVGSQDFLERMAGQLTQRRRMEVAPILTSETAGSWILRESPESTMDCRGNELAYGPPNSAESLQPAFEAKNAL